MALTEREFATLIIETLAEHPEWSGVAVMAFTEGIRSALSRANERAAVKDRAMLSALVLASPGRVDAQARAMLCQQIVEAINPVNTSAVERGFLERNAPAG